jgi:PhnB protein
MTHDLGVLRFNTRTILIDFIFFCKIKIQITILSSYKSSHVMLSDEFAHGDMKGCRSPKSIGGSAVTLHIYTEDVDKAFNQAVAAGANVTMPLMDMFWGDRYGQIEDPFGHFWSIVTHKQDLTPEQVEKAGADMLKRMMSAKD